MLHYKDRSTLIEKSVYSNSYFWCNKTVSSYPCLLKQDESNQQVHPKIILYILLAHFLISSAFVPICCSLSESITDKMSDIHPKNTFAVNKDAAMKLQVLVKQLSNHRERLHESKIRNWQLKELISGAAKNKSYTTNCHALAVK